MSIASSILTVYVIFTWPIFMYCSANISWCFFEWCNFRRRLCLSTCNLVGFVFCLTHRRRDLDNVLAISNRHCFLFSLWKKIYIFRRRRIRVYKSLEVICVCCFRFNCVCPMTWGFGVGGTLLK